MVSFDKKKDAFLLRGVTYIYLWISRSVIEDGNKNKDAEINYDLAFVTL